MGARLGAIEDIVPAERFEADTGPEAELDPLRTGVANLFEGLDEYADVVDPVTSTELTDGFAVQRRRPSSPAPCPTACATTTPAGSPRRCGGGSSATCPTGASGRPPPCACCSRCSATSGSTPTRRPSPRPSSTPCTPERRRQRDRRFEGARLRRSGSRSAAAGSGCAGAARPPRSPRRRRPAGNPARRATPGPNSMPCPGRCR